MSIEIQQGDALIVVDLQNDFLPGGALAVPEGDAVIEPLNAWIARFADEALPVVATRDWHPPNHCSFAAQGGSWPPHCIQGTPGAELTDALELPDDAELVSKADQPDRDAYSGFERTGLRDRLEGMGVRRVFVGGLATDYCVLNTVKDALRAGFETFLLTDAVRGVEVQPGDTERALEEMRLGGAQSVSLDDLTG